MGNSCQVIEKDFPGMLGEGTIIFNKKAAATFYIKIYSKDLPNCWIGLKISENEAIFLGKGKDDSKAIQFNANIISGKDGGYESGKKVSYWFSFNRDNTELKYGKGYVMNQTVCMTYKFNELDETNLHSVFDPTKKKMFRIETEESRPGPLEGSIQDVEHTVNFLPYPLINNFPPRVKDSKAATMLDIGSQDYLLSANLPVPCQQLYAVIASSNITLDPKLLKAINYSIKTKGKTLREKIDRKNGSPNMSEYLRVAIGDGSSPGIPYVLELWPPRSKSQIHNHGNVYGIIKVIHGSIDIHIYNKTWQDSDSSMVEFEDLKFTAEKDDVTWLSPNWYQTHHLENSSEGEDDLCATIQCYKYGKDDEVMWPYFDYISKTSIKEYKPVIDFQFSEMCAIVMSEYNEHRK